VEAGGEEAIVPQMGDAALQRKRSIRNPCLRKRKHGLRRLPSTPAGPGASRVA
jgi:hypothetical protein